MNGDIPVIEKRHLAIPRSNGEAPVKIPMWMIKVIGPVILAACLSWAAWVTVQSFYVKVMAEDIGEIKKMLQADHATRRSHGR